MSETSSRRPRGNERVLTVRIPAALADELDRCVQRLRVQTPWAQMTRSDAVRWILLGALRRDELRVGDGIASPVRPEQSKEPPSGVGD